MSDKSDHFCFSFKLAQSFQLIFLNSKFKSFAFVITQGIVRTKATLQAASVLSQFGAVAPSVISNRTSYANAMGQGVSAGSFDKVAEEEISNVWNFISGRLFDELKNIKQKLTA